MRAAQIYPRPIAITFNAFVILNLLFCTSFAQDKRKPENSSPTKFTAEQLKSDLQVLRSTLESAHGGLYKYSSKQKLDSAFSSVQKSIVSPLTELQFFRVIAPLIDLIHDAHTSMSLSKKTFQFLGKEGKVFPLDVRYYDSKLYVEKNFDQTTPGLKKGSEIVSVDGVPVSKITQIILKAKSTDGYNQAAKIETANSAFWLLYFEMMSEASQFTIKVRESGVNEIKTFTLNGVSGRLIQQDQFSVQLTDTFSVEFSNTSAIMRIPTFMDITLYEKFEIAFKQIKEKKVDNLIIDIRNNNGGYDELNTTLLSYLIPHPFQFYKGFEIRASEWKDLQNATFDPEDFYNKTDLKNIPASELNAKLKQNNLKEALHYYMKTNPAMGIHNPNSGNFYNGKTYLLFNGGSTSSGGEVPALLHFYGIGTLVGEEPNAGYEGTTAGVLTKLTLPVTGIRFTIPLIAYKNNVLEGINRFGGAKPHFEISQTIEDAINEKDTALDFVIKLIAQRIN